MKNRNVVNRLLGIKGTTLFGLVFIIVYVWSGKYQEIARDSGTLAAIAPMVFVFLALGIISYIALSKSGIIARR